MQNEYLKKYQEETLRACQLKQLDILTEIDKVCRKHDIPYWLDGGTLLGAVRHGGFIPWDDDIDIAMRRDDMERFIALAPSDLPEHLFVQTPQNEPTKEPIVKIRDLNSFFVEGGDNFAAPYQKGVYVDIFPFVDYPNLSPKLTKTITRGISKSYSILHKAHYYSLRAVAEFFWFGAKYAFFSGLWALAKLTTDCHRKICVIPRNNGYGVVYNVEGVFPLGTITFEGKTFPAPADPDHYLSALYRDYMAIPPLEKRQIHSVFFLPTLVKG